MITKRDFIFPGSFFCEKPSKLCSGVAVNRIRLSMILGAINKHETE